jgi:signal transduction histidine kinase
MESQALIYIHDQFDRLRRTVSRLFNSFVSVPIFIKILGAGMFVVILFGMIVLYRTRIGMARTMYNTLENETKMLAFIMSTNLERTLAVQDYLSAKIMLQETKKIYPNVLYGILEDNANRIIVHTFDGAVPPDLVNLLPPVRNFDKKPSLEVFGTEDGFIMESSIPILQGAPLRLRIGASDRLIRQKLSGLTWLLLVSTIFCALLGFGLALVLAYLITRPIKNLLTATNKISRGDFTSRAQVLWDDEIGQFAGAFNHMAENLQQYRREVEEKEATRQALLEKIILIQEQERRRIAQDLHDQLGQSLSVLLMNIQSMSANMQCMHCVCDNHHIIEERISALIDEVRQLAWGMHPSILDDYGLDKALERYIKTMSQTTRIDIDYQCLCRPGLTRLPLRTEVALYRIAQEAITNIARHASTKQASVVFMRNESETVLLIEDEGRGFDMATAARNDFTHMGLIGMNERVSMLSGELTVESAPGMGTTIRVKI